uniref:PTTG1IP n=1 Tax=Panagrolaimus sp. PS1159 TaxID=55785 RepID=A0AC35G3K1_9BILA
MNPEHVILLQIFCYFIKDIFAAPIENLNESVHQKKTCDICSGSLYYCKEFNSGEFGCEMDNIRFGAVVIFAALTGIIFPIACISLYVCGFYSKIKYYLTSSVKRGTEDISLLERDYQRDATDNLPSISIPSIESIKPIERKYKKNPNRFSQPQKDKIPDFQKMTPL